MKAHPLRRVDPAAAGLRHALLCIVAFAPALITVERDPTLAGSNSEKGTGGVLTWRNPQRHPLYS